MKMALDMDIVLITGIVISLFRPLYGHGLIMDVRPTDMKTNQTAILNCIYVNQGEATTRRGPKASSSFLATQCFFHWRKSSLPGVVYEDNLSSGLHVTTIRDAGGVPFQSTVRIPRLQDTDQGIYRCQLQCPGKRYDASFRLQLSDPKGWDTMLLAVGCIAIVVLIAITVVVCYQCCHKLRVPCDNYKSLREKQASLESS